MLHSFQILVWTLCVLPTSAGWFNQGRTSLQYPKVRSPRQGDNHAAVLSSSAPPLNYTFSLPSPSVIIPTPTSQFMFVTSVVPLYEICPIPGSDADSCSTAFTTFSTSSCSTVLTYAFRKLTVTDCNQNITFSTDESYSLATATASIQQHAVTLSLVPTLTTYVVSVTSYYEAPWQSLAADTLENVKLRVCKDELSGKQNCSEVQQVWALHAEDVLVTITSTISITTVFTTPVVLLLGPSQSVTANAGPFDLSTEIEYSTMSFNATTRTVITDQSLTSTTTLTTTFTVTNPAVTVTRLVQYAPGYVPPLSKRAIDTRMKAERCTHVHTTLRSTARVTSTVMVGIGR